MNKGCLLIFFTSSLLCMLAILRSVEYVAKDDYVEYEPGETKVNGNSLTKFQVFPRGGDEVPSQPNWTIPTVRIETDASKFLDSGDRFIATNFSFSPGLGNNIFQYASLLGIAQRHNATLLLPDSGLVRRCFVAPSAQVVSQSVLKTLSQAWSGSKLVLPDCCRYYESSENLTESAFVMGYVQSWRYFHPHAQALVRSDLAFLPFVESESRRFLDKALTVAGRPVLESENSTLIGLHMRRGMDIAWNVRNMQHGHVVAPVQYLLKAIETFRSRYPNATFVVVSDNLYWCRKHLKAPDVVFLATGTREMDLGALSLCHHTIMSTGTFSWWAAYLAGGEAIYYDQWPRNGSKMAQMTHPTDFFLPHWQPMS